MENKHKKGHSAESTHEKLSEAGKKGAVSNGHKENGHKSASHESNGKHVKAGEAGAKAGWGSEE